jgi:hypothetical protein
MFFRLRFNGKKNDMSVLVVLSGYPLNDLTVQT